MKEDWIECTFEELLDYEQPTKYIVKSTKYDDNYKTPVLTAGKTFIKGYTNEPDGIFENLPTIIFDDFTTASQFVNFKFKVKSSAMKILVPKSKLVNMLFTYYAMQVNRVRSDTHKRYWISVFAKKKFLLPSLGIQKAIVSKIETLFSDLDQGIADLKKAQDQLKIYRQAVLKKAFEGELTKEWRDKQTDLPSADELLKQIKEERQNYFDQQLAIWKEAVIIWKENKNDDKKPAKPKFIKKLVPFSNEELQELPNLNKNWQWVKIDKIASHEASSLKAGPFGSSLKKESYVEYGFKIYGQEQVISNNHQIGNYYVNEEKYNSLINCAVKPFDVLISLVGTVGKVLVLPENCERGIINPRLVKITLSKFYNPIFYKYYFESAFLKSIYSIKSHGATMDILNLGIIKELPYPLCTLTEQHQIVKEIESRLSVCDAVEQNISESLEKANALRQSILKKAFEGKLLSEEEIAKCKAQPDYEPASVLLERIKEEKKQK
ncbi:MAG: restriction endonuclease subunit S [Flavobacteriaceae bacterium]|nr:restriction endonuclease subunit S [Flavobacteriaceae bacterium]